MGLFNKALKKIVGEKKKARKSKKVKKKKTVKKRKPSARSKRKVVKKRKPSAKSIRKTRKAKPKTKKKAAKKPKRKTVKRKPVRRKTKRIIRKKPKRTVRKKSKLKKRKAVKKRIRKGPVKKKSKKKTKRKTKKKAAKKAPKKPLIIPLEAKISKRRALTLLKEPEVVEFINENAGEEGYKIYDYLVRVGKEVDEYTLADKVDLQINFVRSLLYKLYEFKLVSFFRERDKKKGWFIYSWEAHPEKLKYILIKRKEDKIAKLKEKMKISEDSFYCENCDKTVTYSHAMETMFFCDSCGGHLVAMNSLDVKRKIEHEIEKIKKQIKVIEKI